jgi:hypothetical protein
MNRVEAIPEAALAYIYLLLFLSLNIHAECVRIFIRKKKKIEGRKEGRKEEGRGAEASIFEYWLA